MALDCCVTTLDDISPRKFRSLSQWPHHFLVFKSSKIIMDLRFGEEKILGVWTNPLSGKMILSCWSYVAVWFVLKICFSYCMCGVCACVCTCAYMSAHVSVYMRVCMYVHVSVCTQVCAYKCVRKMCACECVHVNVHENAPQCACEGQRVPCKSRFSPTLWVLGIKFRSSALVVGPSSAEPSHWPSIKKILFSTTCFRFILCIHHVCSNEKKYFEKTFPN